MFSDLVGSTALSARMDPPPISDGGAVAPNQPKLRTDWVNQMLRISPRRRQGLTIKSDGSHSNAWVGRLRT